MQFEFPWALGPEPGRYTIREQLGEPPAHVLVIAVLGAPRAPPAAAAARRARPATRRPSRRPSRSLTSRATLVDTAALDGYEAAAAWLAGADLDALADAALARLNRVLHAHRIAAADPYAREVARAQALVVRVGFGNGERVADGRWDRARELPRARAGAALRPRDRRAAPAGAPRRAARRRATSRWPARS